MLATMFVMPGGLVFLLAVAFVVVFARTARGRRLLVGVTRRVPPRVRARVKRVLSALHGENIFLPQPPPVGPA